MGLAMKRFTLLTAAAALAFAGATGASAAGAGRAPAQGALGGHPNLNGVWQAMNTANWDLVPHSAAEAPAASRHIGAIGAVPPGLGVVVGGTIPYTADALKKRDELRRSAPQNDPEAACYLPGIPRATYMNFPFQIIQANDGDMLMAYEYDSANRVIAMGPVGIPPIDTWMGTSYGHWEGNTLVVTTLSENPGDVIAPGGAQNPGVTWLDRSGNYLVGTSTVVEKFTLMDKDHIDYEATISDPAIYTKPWTIKMPLYRRVEDNAQILEFNCVPFSELMLYGDLLENNDSGQK
jgi:hypothetical protein